MLQTYVYHQNELEMHYNGRRRLKNVKCYQSDRLDEVKISNVLDIREQILEFESAKDVSICVKTIVTHLSSKTLSSTIFDLWLHGLSLVLSRRDLNLLKELCCKMFASNTNDMPTDGRNVQRRSNFGLLLSKRTLGLAHQCLHGQICVMVGWVLQ
ncbi:hypothetical protein RFI_25646 [Reticulomyxa filosa]|uniref:Uncharacterized protein n=1 Tax=Reticulomyxa filosa TaxID=46433 RepID=X6MFB1_RETFI|nr:hypothetical protein RFI_25646 [Reticulomyxa filosa]|eukprot:ETO11730.1 hypothetical protein RFI_25646 [Reticulomyxa filosa]